jgi:ribosomal protein S18 acetylase RimI-like enzyme
MDKSIMNITITNATLDDVDTLFRWGEENEELWSHQKTRWYPKESLRKRIKSPKNTILLVARVDGKLAGVCMVEIIRDWTYCSGLYIDTPFRRRGIGRLLMTEAIAQLKKKRMDGLDLLVEVDNDTALAFYNTHGFTKGHTFHWMYKSIMKEKGTRYD